MAFLEMDVRVLEEFNNPYTIQKLNDELIKQLNLIVCFYTPAPDLLPVRQNDGTWPLRLVGKDMIYRVWLREFFFQKEFEITREEYFTNSHKPKHKPK